MLGKGLSILNNEKWQTISHFGHRKKWHKAGLQNGTTEEALNQLELAEEAIGVASEENE